MARVRPVLVPGASQPLQHPIAPPAADGIEARVVDPESGRDQPVDHEGELWLRGRLVTQGYYEKPEETAKAFTPDGWFMTGDRVTLETDGYITFSDRDKDMLKVGGENVAASEIERVIALVPGVYECAIVAQKHRMLDEVPVAFVIAAPSADEAARAALSAQIIAECKAKLADFKVPRAVFVVDEMPRSTLEKIHKAELRKRLPVAE